ncbi:MAG: uncharacterized protein QOF51_1092 [Chloroflexota bacterium]|nr:uncharacterized protein [Chloroflexota bacterium]
MGAPIMHFEIMGGEGKQLEEFYAKLFGWKIDSNNEFNYGVVETGGEGGINGGVGPAMEGQPPRVTVYAQVADPDAVLKEAEALGGTILMPTTNVMEGVTIALIADPAGNVTGLLKG